MDIESAKKLDSAIPVKLSVDEFSNLSYSFQFDSLSPGQFVQGCMVGQGVFAVYEKSLKIVET